MSQELTAVEVQIRGMDCGNCALGIEKHLRSIGVKDARVSIATESAFVKPTAEIPLSKIYDEIRGLGYTVTSNSSSESAALVSINGSSRKKLAAEPIDHEHSHTDRGFLGSGLAVAIAVIFTVPFLVHMIIDVPILHSPLLQAVCALVACAIGLARFIPSALNSLRARVPNMEVLICIGIFSSLGYSFYGWIIGSPESFAFFESAATISSLVLVGGWLEHKVTDKARSAISELSKLQPSFAVRVRGEVRETVPTKSLVVGDVVAVNAGDQVPCDGTVQSGTCLVDESIATGESELQTKSLGAAVISGTVVRQGSSLVRIDKPEHESFIASMVNLVKLAQAEKPPISRSADRVAAIFVPLILVISLLTLVGALALGISVADSVTRAVAVLVIACPCALGLATPAAVMIGIGRAAKRNILFRSGASVEALAKIEAIAFDKTGTLTKRDIDVEITSSDARFEVSYLAGLAKALESYSSHPIAKKIIEKFADAPSVKLSQAHEEVGAGVKGVTAEGATVFIGRDPRHQNQTVIMQNDAVVGTLLISESLRSGASSSLEYFQSSKLPILVVSGDTQQRCEALKLGSDVAIYGAQSPQQKWDTLTARKQQLAFVGDGINDAPVMASAAVGIALGDASSVAVNSADIILVGSSLAPLATAHKMAKATLTTIRENLFWAFSYNIVAVPLAMAGLLNPSWAALAMGFSDIVLVLNSMRLQVKRFD